MAVNDGSIYRKGTDRHGKPVWRIQITFGTDSATGKPIRKSACVHGTKAEARAVRDKMRADYGNGLSLDADKVTLKQLCDGYMEARRVAATAQPERLESQAQQLRVICGILGDGTPLKDITPMTIQGLYPKLADSIRGRGKDGRCSTSTLHAYHVSLNAAMKYAVAHDLLVRNPCDKVEAPKPAKSDRRSLTAGEAARLLREVDKAEAEAYAEFDAKEGRRRDPDGPRGYVRGLAPISYVLAVRIGLATGMRLGEALAMRWQQVDSKAGTIDVSASLTRRGRRKDNPKTASSRRVVALDARTASHLGRWKAFQAGCLAGIGIGQGGETPVLCGANGSMLKQAHFERWWKPWSEERGFGGLRYHELRHTQCTVLLANGVDVKTVQTRLGHSSAAFTLDRYGHAVPQNDRAAADMLGALLANGGKAPDDGPERGRIIELKTA